MDLMIALDDEAAMPLYRQLYEQLRGAILSGRLARGERLPASRSLAGQLGISRNTVTESYDQLLAEGYLESRAGSGTYVSRELPERLLYVNRAQSGVDLSGQEGTGLDRPDGLSVWARRVQRVSDMPLAGGRAPAIEYDFRTGNPAVDAFPFVTWQRIRHRYWQPGNAEALRYAPAAGLGALRQALESYLRRARAVRCSPEQIVVVNGSQQALDLLARLCVDAGDAAMMEDPGYQGARLALATHGARLVPIPVDVAGMQVDRLREQEIRLIYVTPSHQYPTGGTLSLARRLELLDWARLHRAWILEDDYDSEFRYSGRPLESLQGLDQSGRVVYIGTFSKVLFPALRLGYVVLPEPLVESFVRAKWLSDRHTPLLEQQVLADFIEEGHFERHLRRMRTLYRSRQQAMLEALQAGAGELFDLEGSQAGMHLVAWLRSPLREDTVIRALGQAGIHAPGIGPYYLDRSSVHPGLLLGYTALPEDRIRAGIRRLLAVLQRLADGRRET